MNHPPGVLDTSTVLRIDELSEGDMPNEPVITTITLAELTAGPLVAQDLEIRSARQMQLQSAESSYGDPLPFDVEAARMFGHVAADLREAGNKGKARAFDVLIGAIARADGLPVYTFNPGDFEPITDLEVVALPTTSSRR